MSKIPIRIFFCIATMMALLLTAFITDHAVNKQLFASLGILTGAFTNKFLSTPKTHRNE